MKKSKIVLGVALVVILVAVVIYGLLNVVSIVDPETSATIKTEIPMLTASSIGLSLNGGLTITAPDVPGHWEIKEYGYFTDSKEVEFCLIETIGIEEFIFIPDDPNMPTTSIYSAVFVWRAHIAEIILALLIVMFITVYINTKTSPTTQKEKFIAT